MRVILFCQLYEDQFTSGFNPVSQLARARKTSSKYTHPANKVQIQQLHHTHATSLIINMTTTTFKSHTHDEEGRGRRRSVSPMLHASLYTQTLSLHKQIPQNTAGKLFNKSKSCCYPQPKSLTLDLPESYSSSL